MKYPFTPDYILHLPQPAERAMLALEEYLLKDICERLQITKEVTATAQEHIKILIRNGYDISRIAKKLAQMSGLAEGDIRKAIDDMLTQASDYYSTLYDTAGKSVDLTKTLAADIDAITRATEAEMVNITRSYGFALRAADGSVRLYGPAEAYQRVLDDALVKVNQGISYADAMRTAVRQLADSGIQSVEYQKEADTGEIKTHVNRADVAVRRAVNTGVSKLSMAYADRAGEDLETPYVEVTAHAGARDKDEPHPWSNHKAWQGKIYSKQTGDKYPSVYDVCGLGEVDGLCGANCRHTYHPFIPGVMIPTYTDDDLAQLDKPPCEYEGKRYTQYEASQLMRRTETSLRALKRRMIAFSASGDREAYSMTAARYRATKEAYGAFSKAAGLRSQMLERSYIYQWGPKEEMAAEAALQAAQA